MVEERTRPSITDPTDAIVRVVLEGVGGAAATETAFAITKAGAVVGRVGLPHDATIDANTP